MHIPPPPTPAPTIHTTLPTPIHSQATLKQILIEEGEKPWCTVQPSPGDPDKLYDATPQLSPEILLDLKESCGQPIAAITHTDLLPRVDWPPSRLFIHCLITPPPQHPAFCRLPHFDPFAFHPPLARIQILPLRTPMV